MIDYKVYCPSYKRSEIARSHLIFEKSPFCYVVREEEAEQYEHFGVELMKIPRNTVSNLCQTRNWIMENKNTEYVVMVDDDYSSINRLVNRKLIKQDPEQVHEFIQQGFIMALDCGAGYWGMNVIADPMAYSINKPFQFGRVVLGPFMAVVDCSIRIDERLYLKEDYDFFLQQMQKHRKALRFDMYSYSVDHQKLKGGCQTYRTAEIEKEQNELLKKKWGSVVCDNTRFPNSINMRIRTGL